VPPNCISPAAAQRRKGSILIPCTWKRRIADEENAAFKLVAFIAS
jgi:hypothetical protein